MVHAVDQKFGIIEIVELNERLEKRAGSAPRRLVTSILTRSFDSTCGVSHFPSPSTSVRFPSTATRDGSAVGGSLWASKGLCVQFQAAP